jgi:hypothetical protein
MVSDRINYLGVINNLNSGYKVAGFDLGIILLVSIILMSHAILGVLSKEIFNFGTVFVKRSL